MRGEGKAMALVGLTCVGGRGVPWLLSAKQLEMRAEQSLGVRGTADKPGALQKARVLSLSERRGLRRGRWRRAEREDASLGEPSTWGHRRSGGPGPQPAGVSDRLLSLQHLPGPAAPPRPSLYLY